MDSKIDECTDGIPKDDWQDESTSRVSIHPIVLEDGTVVAQRHIAKNGYDNYDSFNGEPLGRSGFWGVVRVHNSDKAAQKLCCDQLREVARFLAMHYMMEGMKASCPFREWDMEKFENLVNV